jgi:hypothetical protein
MPTEFVDVIYDDPVEVPVSQSLRLRHAVPLWFISNALETERRRIST